MMTQTLIVQLIVVLNSTNDLILLLRGHLQSDNKRRGISPSPPLPPYLDRHGGHSSSPQSWLRWSWQALLRFRIW
ncbi:hypothetical protein HanRHA438_Chr12g0549131 [Helianthus annuus]|uniref:Uncharacterized protein n=1 Tax=Helianthus annuus TaxID=4232 RepID=A0A9K3HG27_HELAN|nr:hypothetical protein HanXRQr2_Chr12g0538271 [Helianthus annuus]KAJ0489163.1 hypothetical protein HanHA300_Chr12g0440861 [Helianthus annuus]KAJ0505039.1 hypothetical protein HanHA89_Chr12g0465961 [Helianthus annuus]KAJ0674724.1 hypothetical protein HanLR1_Chr12g0443091 [Helianthus annuus]KAJ0862430.1 hypothetical protein HanPSC8_Chr12g0518091 [Helianthus annuus]